MTTVILYEHTTLKQCVCYTKQFNKFDFIKINVGFYLGVDSKKP